jgi:hypothetical protein
MGQGKQVKRGVLKSLGERSFWLSSSCVIFLGKGRRRMRSFGRWWKGESGLDVWGASKNKSKQDSVGSLKIL